MQSKLGRARQHITQGTPDLAHRLLLPWIGWFTVTTHQVSKNPDRNRTVLRRIKIYQLGTTYTEATMLTKTKERPVNF
jgi:hypothetical protein